MSAARVRFTTTADGDLAVGGAAGPLSVRRQALAPHPWTWLHQVHGAEVVVVTEPGGSAGAHADAAVTAVDGAVLAVHTADCVPVILVAETVIGVAHAGWRGLRAGVVEAAVAAMAALGATDIRAQIGPAIRARCYEFGAAEAASVVERIGPAVLAETAWGTPALDVVAGVHEALERSGVHRIHDDGICTACSPLHYSFRARADRGRQAGLVWLERSEVGGEH